MITSGSIRILTGNPLGTTPTTRVDDFSRSPNLNPEDKTAELQRQQRVDAVVRKLRTRDSEVRMHEMAHMAAGGSLVQGGPSFTFQVGPDGRSYAIGGEIRLDVSPVKNDPAATLDKAGRIRSAALAPAQPSSQDFRVAGNANQMAARARVDLAVIRSEEVTPQQKPDQLNTPDTNTIALNDPSTESSASAAPLKESVNSQTEAAIGAFMAIAQSGSKPVIFNLYA